MGVCVACALVARYVVACVRMLDACPDADAVPAEGFRCECCAACFPKVSAVCVAWSTFNMYAAVSFLYQGRAVGGVDWVLMSWAKD